MQDIQQKNIFRMWWSYHKKWSFQWWQAIRPKTRENVLGGAAGAICAVIGWHYGHITKDRLWSAIIIGAAGYGVIFLCYSIWAALFLSSKIDHEQEGEICKLQTELGAKTEEWIAAKKETLDAYTTDLETRKELVKALSELAQAQKAISNSSDAFHAEYTKNSALRRELDRFKSNRVKEEWKKLENDFADVGGGSNMTTIAFWERKKSDGSMVWHLMSGWDQGSRDRFRIVMDEAGQLLLSSDYFKSNYSEYAEEDDSVSRWLLTLAKELDEPMQVTGTGYTKTEGETESGEISELPRKCVLCCARFAAQEKWPSPKKEEGIQSNERI